MSPLRGGLQEDLGRLALVMVADDQARCVDGNLLREAVHVLPVDADQNIEAIVQALDRVRRDAQQGGRFTATDLGSARAHHQPVPAGARRGFEQQVPGGHDARAAAAGEGNGNVPATGRPGRFGRGVHGGIDT